MSHRSGRPNRLGRRAPWPLPLALTAAGAALAAEAHAQQESWRVDGVVRDERFGAALLLVPDRTGDGVPELLVGAPATASSQDGGHARLLSGSDLALLFDIDAGDPPAGFGVPAGQAGATWRLRGYAIGFDRTVVDSSAQLLEFE